MALVCHLRRSFQHPALNVGSICRYANILKNHPLASHCHQSLQICNFALYQQNSRYCSSSSNTSGGRKPLWDDSDWMNQKDSNAEAYAELDVTKLRPFPEFRNVSVGYVWGPNAYELVWNRYYAKQAPKALADKQDVRWQKFAEENGFDPEEYISSPDFKERYADRLIWEDYRRNHKGSRQRQKTRRKCIRFGKVTGNPCPICRDDKLEINFKNILLLKHFIDPYSGEVYHNLRTGVCKQKQKLLIRAVLLATDQGLLPKSMPIFKQNSYRSIESYRIDHPAVQP